MDAYVYGTCLALTFFKPRHGVLKPMKLKALGLLFTLVFSTSSFADICSDHLAGGIAVKGYLDSTALDDPKGYELAKQGMIGWNLTIYIKSSIEAAKHHFELKEAEDNLAKLKEKLAANQDPSKEEDLKKQVATGEEFVKTDINKDPLTKGAYLIADVPENFESLSKEEKLKIYKELMPTAKLVYFPVNVDKEGKNKYGLTFKNEALDPIEISIEARKKIDLEKSSVMPLSVSGVAFRNPGWVLPELRGVLRLDQKTIGGETYKKLKGQARKFAAKGYTFHFNYDFKKSLEMLRDQPRVGQSIEDNRYQLPAVFNAAMKSYEQGRAFSVEMVDRYGKIKGGLICFRYGNIIAINSVFYDPPNEDDIEFKEHTEEQKKAVLKKPWLNYAKITVLPLIDRLLETGLISFIDFGMVSPYSDSLNAGYIFRDEFLDMKNKLPEEDVHINFSGTWTPPVGGPKK